MGTRSRGSHPVPSRPRSAAHTGDRAAAGDGGGRGRPARPPARRTNKGGLRLPGHWSGRSADRRAPSELFEPGRDSLAIYSFMFPRDPADLSPAPAEGETARLPLAEGPCPSCTALLDQLEGAAEHASQHLNLAASPRRRSSEYWRSPASGQASPAPHLLRGQTTSRLPGRNPRGRPAPKRTVFGATRRDPAFWSSELFYHRRIRAKSAARRHPRAAWNPRPVPRRAQTA